ncbi:hypothetical protein BLNAU_14680 [Blattamonas nauphoetae]|uniref:Uncharacterized protein n=1 Tax=Blattamonas nauphoetae TaxID=2049346 RepID=A0ABQ9XHX5_9EUKA|nr:hypothetical protein BLNAU_14680 [Blattamonas nauphoetae]
MSPPIMELDDDSVEEESHQFTGCSVGNGDEKREGSGNMDSWTERERDGESWDDADEDSDEANTEDLPGDMQARPVPWEGTDVALSRCCLLHSLAAHHKQLHLCISVPEGVSDSDHLPHLQCLEVMVHLLRSESRLVPVLHDPSPHYNVMVLSIKIAGLSGRTAIVRVGCIVSLQFGKESRLTSIEPKLQTIVLITFVFVHLFCKLHFRPLLTPLISIVICYSLLLLLSSSTFVQSRLNSQTQKENKDHSHSILVDCIVGLGCTSRTVPSSSSVSLIADSNRPDAKTAMTQFSSCVGMDVVRSLLILKQRSKEMFEMKITLVDDDLGASGSDHGDMNESGETAEHAFVLLVSFVFTRNKGKLRISQPSPIKKPAAPAEGSPLSPSILDVVSRFSLWTLITRHPILHFCPKNDFPPLAFPSTVWHLALQLSESPLRSMPTSPLQYSMGAPTTTYANATNLPWDRVSAGIDTFFTHEVRGQDAETACLCLYSITAKLLSSVFLGQDLYFRTHLDNLFQVLGTNTSQSFEVSLVVSKVAIDCLRMLAEHGSRIEQFDSTLPELIVSHITIKGENLFDQFCSKRVGIGHQHLEAKTAIELSLGLIVEAIVEWLSACPAFLTSVATMGRRRTRHKPKRQPGRNAFLFEDLANRMELNSSTIESGYDRLFSALLSDVFTDSASVATGETGHVVQMNLFETLSKELEQSFSMFRDSRQILSNSIKTHLQLVGKLTKVYITSLAMEQPFSACCIDADEEAVGDDKTVYFSLGSETILEVSERSCPIETEYVCALERPHTATDDPTVVYEKRSKPIQHTTSVHVVIRNAAQAAKQAAAQVISLPTTPKALNNQHTPKLPSPQLSEDSESPKTTLASVSETGTSQPLQPFSTALTSEKTNEDPFEVDNTLAAIETFNKLNVVTDDEHLNQLANSIADFEEDIKPVPIEGEEEFEMEVSAVVNKRRESSIHNHLHHPSPLVSHAQFALRSPSPSSPPSPKAVFRRHPPPPFSIARSFLAQFKLVDVDTHLSLKQLKSQVATRTMMKLIDTLVVKKTYEIGIVYAAPGCTDEESILTFTEGLDAPSEDTPQPLDAPPKDKLEEQTEIETDTTQKTRRVSGLFWQFVDQLCWRVDAEGHLGYLGTTKIISKLEEKEVETKDPIKDLLEAKQDDERLRSQVSARSVNKSPPLVSPQSSPSPPASLVEDVPDSLSQSRTPKSSQSFSERRPSSSRQMTPTLSPSPTFPRYKNASTPDELEGGLSRIERKDTIAQKISAGAVPQCFYYPASIPETIRREQLQQERLERKRSQEERKQKLEEKRKIAELTSQLMLMENRRQEALTDSNDADVSQFLEAEKKQRMQIERMLKECKSDETEIEDEEAAIRSLSIEDEVEAELPPLLDLPPNPKGRKEIVMWEIQAAKRKCTEMEE